VEKSRAELLSEVLQSDPDNTFVRYALALELSSSTDPATAWSHFEYLLAHHPEYSAAYFQAGKFLVKQGRVEEAKQVLAKGIEVNRRQGNQHTQSELEAALDELNGG